MWNLDTANRFVLGNAKENGTAPIGFFFAPSSEGREPRIIEYTVATIGKITKLVSGSGMADNAITLKVKTNFSNGTIQQISCGVGCQEITMPKSGRVLFKVTPNINQDAVRGTGLGL